MLFNEYFGTYFLKYNSPGEYFSTGVFFFSPHFPLAFLSTPILLCILYILLQ